MFLIVILKLSCPVKCVNHECLAKAMEVFSFFFLKYSRSFMVLKVC